ncbi:MAG: hypothetical protein IPF81_15740 [Bacteroidetes bacterium]|nr:hypothetical protein [Bacteroidota bacterium]
MKEELDKNIFGAEDSWPGVKQELDRHFRKKRIVFWLSAMSVVGILLFSTFWLNTNFHKVTPQVNNETSIEIKPSQEQNFRERNLAEKINQNPNSISNDEQKAIVKEQPGSSQALDNNKGVQKEALRSIAEVKEHTSSREISNSESAEQVPVIEKSSEAVSTVQAEIETQNSKANIQTSPSKETQPSVDPSRNITLAEELKTTSPLLFEPLAFIPPLKHRTFNNPVENALITRSGEVPPFVSKTKSQLHWSASVYGGSHYLTKEITAAPGPWLDRRNEEEQNVVLPSFGASVAASGKLLAISVGIEYSSWGEKTDYSSMSLQAQLEQSGNWQTYVYSVTDTDTAYYYGNQYFLQSIVQRTDSNYISVVDTVIRETYDPTIASANGINRYWYFEIPVEISVRHSFGKFGLGASAGLSPAWLVSKKGNYLKKDMSGVESLGTSASSNSMILNGRFSLDLYYQIHSRLNLVLRPQVKGNLQSVFTSSSAYKQKYTGTGILFGVNYTLR